MSESSSSSYYKLATRMAVHGTLAPFDPEQEDWVEYTDRLSYYFTANGISDNAKKRAILLSCCGPATFRLMKSLVFPDQLSDFSFAQLVEKVKVHREPKASIIVRRFQFNSRTRSSNESIADYVAALRRLAEHCSFGDMLEEMLRDRLVCGINNGTIQKRLLAEPDLTLTKAISVAQAAELADLGARELQLSTAGASKVLSPEDKDIYKCDSDLSARNVESYSKAKECYRCGARHNPDQCRFKFQRCHACGKQGHIAKVCRTHRRAQTSKSDSPSQATHQVVELSSNINEYNLLPVGCQEGKPLQTTVQLEGHPFVMEVDTGAAVSLINENTYRSFPFLKRLPLQSSTVQLRTYTGEKIAVKGEISVTVQRESQSLTLPLIVVPGQGPSLLGRNWLLKLQLDWKNIFTLQVSSLQNVLVRYSSLFQEGLGTLKQSKVKFFLKEGATPKFFKARPVPLALQQRVTAELDRLQAEGIIIPIKVSDWATPIVPVMKRDGSIRICGDFKLTVNQATQTEVYPLPRIDEIFASLSGGTIFSTLDLSHAYNQLQLDDKAQELTTINTHRGLYAYTRLPFGVASAPAIFQRTMETLLKDLPMTCVYIDDILVAGKTPQDHLTNLTAVLNRLQEAGLRLKREKCSFCVPEVEYLGHIISAAGLKPSPRKTKAIINAPRPTKLSELKSFLGILSYYSKFLPKVATTLAPLYKLLQKNQKWQWNTEQEKSYNEAKQLLTSSQILTHFDSNKPLILACDASPWGVGAVLSHVVEGDKEKPIAYASRSLSSAERKYSQLDKEALAIVFGVTRFHQFVYGRQFSLYSDHKPLIHIFNEAKSVPAMASARLQRWALTLGAYSYSIKFKKGSLQANADALSRLPLPDHPQSVPVAPEVIASLEHLSTVPLSAAKLRTLTSRNPILAKVRQFVCSHWPLSLQGQPAEVKPFWNRKHELSVQDDVLLWGSRVVVPDQAQSKVLELLHETHIGTSRMKSLARQFVWWPNMDAAIEQHVKSCATCQMSTKDPPVTPLHPWEWPQAPWSRVHADFAGPFLGKMYLILIDAHSKWMEVHITSAATSAVTINKMKLSFSTLGLPEILVTDNGPAFASQEFAAFVKANGIKHITSVPYHPASNGLAERAVQTFKAAMKKLKTGALEDRVMKFLFKYRITPQSTTGQSPSDLLFGRRLRSHFDLLRPDLGAKIRQKQNSQKQAHDLHARERCFEMDDQVLAKNFKQGSPWLPGVIVNKRSATSLLVRLSDDSVIRRHPDQLRHRSTDFPLDSPLPNDSTDDVLAWPDFPTVQDPFPPTSCTQQTVPRHSNRTRRPPSRFRPDS